MVSLFLKVNPEPLFKTLKYLSKTFVFLKNANVKKEYFLGLIIFHLAQALSLLAVYLMVLQFLMVPKSAGTRTVKRNGLRRG